MYAVKRGPEEGGISPKSMLRECSRWHDEHKHWKQEIERWQRDQHLAAVLLYRLDQAVPEVGEELRQHAEGIQQHEQQLNEMEHRLTATHPTERGLQCLARDYRKGAQQHAAMRTFHDAFRRRHEVAMVELKRLAARFDH